MSNIVLAVRARIYRDGLVNTLAARQDLVVAAVAADAHAALTEVRRHQPDVLLVDTAMEGAVGLVSMARTLSAGTRAIALAVSATDDSDLMSWAEAGALGFVTCDNTLDEFLASIDAALAGELACSPRVSAALLRRLSQLATQTGTAGPVGVQTPNLTPRQRCVLQMLHAGLSNKQIARELGVELATVKHHVHQVLHRLQVRHRHEAVSVTPMAPFGPDFRARGCRDTALSGAAPSTRTSPSAAC